MSLQTTKQNKVQSIGEQSRVIVSHISDLDGRVSRELYVMYAGLPANTSTVWVEYGNLIAKAQSSITEWATGKDVTILDFSISQAFLNEVAEVAETVLVFDHHTGTRALVAPSNATIICNTKESTVSLLQKYYVGYETLFTNVCREIDLNLIDNIKAIGHKLYFDSIFFSKDKNLQVELDKLFDDSTVPAFYEAKGKEEIEIAKSLANQAVIDRADRTATVFKSEEHRGIETDIIAHFMLKNKKIDFARIAFDLEKDNLRIFSVRKLKENPRSLEDYCEARGGGGRETAGAFSEMIDDELYLVPCQHETRHIDTNRDTRCSLCEKILEYEWESEFRYEGGEC
ncbi:hypothetical protein MNB_SV-14-1039 [hydrothermal vent metagenome]|uniref:Uncharacterized protein n=1 Tax=hydrothermal vent metagenome TaxID=652676 RepID=A0A1W1CD38_9ZZZZ